MDRTLLTFDLLLATLMTFQYVLSPTVMGESCEIGINEDLIQSSFD
jgi:hypothetical protein